MATAAEQNKTSAIPTVKEEATKPATGGGAEFINLKVKRQDGNVIHVRIKRSTKLEKLMVAYCVELSFVAFLFDGRRIRPEQTPDEKPRVTVTTQQLWKEDMAKMTICGS